MTERVSTASSWAQYQHLSRCPAALFVFEFTPWDILDTGNVGDDGDDSCLCDLCLLFSGLSGVIGSVRSEI